MLNLIIKSDAGLFLVNSDDKHNYWSKEYPDAKIFTSKKEARSIFKKSPLAMQLVGAEIIQDYGLESEKVVV